MRVTEIQVDARNLRLPATSTGLEAAMIPLDPGAVVLNGPLAYPSLASLTSGAPAGLAKFQVGVADTLTPGRLLRFRVEFTDDAGLFCRDTVEAPAGVPTARLVDPAQALPNAIAVLVATCPCALSLAAPAAFSGAQSALAQRRVLLARIAALESLAEVDVLACDKTGTLTTGSLWMKRSALPLVRGVYGRVRRCLSPSSAQVVAKLLAR